MVPRVLVAGPDADLPAHVPAVFVGLQPRRMDAVNGEFLVAVFGIAGDADCADDIAVIVTDHHAAAFGKELIVAGADQVAHEDRLFMRALAHQLRTAAERQRRIGFAERHLEADHRGAVFLLERLHLAAGLDDDDAYRPAIERHAAFDHGVDDTLGLSQRDVTHGWTALLSRGVFCHLPPPCAIDAAAGPPLASCAAAGHMCADAIAAAHRHRALRQDLQDRTGGGRHLVHAG